MPFLRPIRFRQLSLPIIILLLPLLACSLGENETFQGRRIVYQLPTLTPTVMANLPPKPETSEVPNPAPSLSEPTPPLVPAPMVGSASKEAAVSIEPGAASEAAPALAQTIEPAPEIVPTATDTPKPLPPAPTPEIAGWLFAGIRTHYSDSSQNLSMYGDVINNTGTSQRLAALAANFFDGQGQLITASGNKTTVDYWPGELIPAGERLPFKLTVFNIENVADFELSVEAQPVDQFVHHEFEFFDVTEGNKLGQHCMQGRLRNVGPPVQEVIVVGALYNDQDQMLQFGEYERSVSGIDLAAQPLEFEVCFNINNPALIARRELRAWGQ